MPGHTRGHTHIILLALQLLPKLELVCLQFVQGVPELLGLVPGEVAEERMSRHSPGPRTPGPPRRPPQARRLPTSACPH